MPVSDWQAQQRKEREWRAALLELNSVLNAPAAEEMSRGREGVMEKGPGAAGGEGHEGGAPIMTAPSLADGGAL